MDASNLTIADIMGRLFASALAKNEELRERWIAQSEKMGKIAGDAHLPSLQSNARLDIVVRLFESERDRGEKNFPDWNFQLQNMFSEYWVTKAYEVVRSANQQLDVKKQPDKKIKSLLHKLGLVRMPLDKAEIQGTGNASRNASRNGSLILALPDGSEPKQYEANGSYFLPRGICPQTGSIVWKPADVSTTPYSTAFIRRIDLSDELLTIFD